MVLFEKARPLLLLERGGMGWMLCHIHQNVASYKERGWAACGEFRFRCHPM